MKKNHGGRGGYQVSDGKNGLFNQTLHTLSKTNIKGEVKDFCKVLGTTAKQIKDKYQLKKFRNKFKQYILQEIQNPKDITSLVQDANFPLTLLNTSIPTELSTED